MITKRQFRPLARIAVLLATLPLGVAMADDCFQFQWGPVARFPEPVQGGSVRPSVRIASDPVVATNRDGRLEVFAIGVDGALWHSLQTINGRDWSDVTSLGSPPNQQLTTTRGSFAAAHDRAGRMTVIAISDGVVWTIRQVSMNGTWGNWEQFQKTVVPRKGPSPRRPPRPSTIGTPRHLWLVANQDGLLELLVEHDQKLNHTWQLDPDSWANGFVEFGWPNGSYGDLAVTLDRVGRLVVAAVSLDSAFVRRQVIANGVWEDSWTALGNSAIAFGPLVVLAPNRDGRLELLVESQIRDEHQPTKGIYSVQYWHTWQGNENAWSGSWENLGAPYPYLQWEAIDATITPNLDGCLAISALSGDRPTGGPATPVRRLTPLYQKRADSSWNTWQIGRETLWNVPTDGRMAVAQRSDHYLEMFVRGRDGTWLHAGQLRNQIIEGP